MSAEPLTSIRDADFIFKNTPVKIMINRNSPEIELAGLKIGPFQKGKEYEVRFWIAQELKKAGIARFREEESLDLAKLNKIFWKEKIQTSQKVASLAEDFYPRLRRYVDELREEIKKPEKMRDYGKARKLSDDIVRLRLKKITSLASSLIKQTDQSLGNLTKEEHDLYKNLYDTISKWRTEILKTKGGSES